jgi:hypothetical protein
MRVSDEIGSAKSWKLLLVSRRYPLVDSSGAHGAPAQLVPSHAMTLPFRCLRCRRVASGEPATHFEHSGLPKAKPASVGEVSSRAFNAQAFVRGLLC